MKASVVAESQAEAQVGWAGRLGQKLWWRQGPGYSLGWKLEGMEAKSHWRQEVRERRAPELVFPSVVKSPRG